MTMVVVVVVVVVAVVVVVVVVINIMIMVVINTRRFTFEMPFQLFDLECRFNWVAPDRLSTRASRVFCSAH